MKFLISLLSLFLFANQAYADSGLVCMDPQYESLKSFYLANKGWTPTYARTWLNSCDVCSWYGVECNDKKEITSLFVVYQRIDTIPPGSLSQIKTIEELTLANNKFTILPTNELNQITALRVLDLTNNLLTSVDKDVVSGLPNLLALILSGNQISRIQRDALDALPRLVTLYLDENKLSLFKKEYIEKISTLDFLDLSQNPLLDIEEDSFESTTQLTNIKMENTFLTSLPETIFNPIKTKLINLSLANNKALSFLPYHLFEPLTSLRVLDLSGLDLSFSFPRYLCDFVASGKLGVNTNMSPYINRICVRSTPKF